MSFQPRRAPSQHIFLPLPPRSLTAPGPSYRKPTLVSTYSHQPDRSIRHDDSSMAYYSPCPIGSDLNYGFDTKTEREDLDEHLDGLCEVLKKVGGERRGGVITWRGMITRIMTAPFEERDGWEMTAIPLDGSVYIELHDPPDVRQKRQGHTLGLADTRQKDQSTWAWQTYMGYAFESFSTIPATGVDRSEDDPEGWSGNVNTNIQWCNVVRSAIGEIPLYLGGEVDCIDGTPHPGLERCMELKTNKVIENERNDIIFQKKLLKHWAQSWLLGVPTIEVGFRTDGGEVQSLKRFNTEDIPRFITSTGNPIWHPSPCLHFLHDVLNLVLSHVLPTDPTRHVADDEHLPEAVVWRFSFVPKRGCELYRATRVEDNGRWGGMLPMDYVRWRMSRHKPER